jgi:hypothetical protein
VRITFNNPGAAVNTGTILNEPTLSQYGWGRFDLTTNAPIAYPANILPGNYSLTVQFGLYTSSASHQPLLNYMWQLPIAFGAAANMQASSNLTDWVTLATVTNRGAPVSWRHNGITAPGQFFRVRP